MPAAIENNIKTKVIKQWLDGELRDKIAADNQIGAGTVSGIINEFKKGIDALEYESVRELSIYCKKQDINLGALASSVRLNNYIQKIGANHDEIEAFIADAANSSEPKKIIGVANQIVQISTSESIPLDMLADRIKRQQKEKQKLEEEIRQRRAILESTNVDILIINDYKKLKEDLNVHGLSIHNLRIVLSILNKMREIGYNPQKIVRELSRIKSLRQEERQLNNSCKTLELRLNGFREILPMCEQIMRAGITFPELLALHTAVVNKADNNNLSREAAAYCIMEDIGNYDKIGGMKNQISKLVVQQYAIGQMIAPREKAIAALMNLQALGVTDGEILNICQWLNGMREKPAN